MRTVLTFCGVYVVSLLPALFIGVQLADFFHSQEEVIAVLMALVLVSVIAIVTFGVAYRVASSARALGFTAIGLAVVAIILEELPALAEAFATRSINPYLLDNAQDVAIAAEMLIPAFIMLRIQWPLLRRRWLVAHGEDRRTS